MSTNRWLTFLPYGAKRDVSSEKTMTGREGDQFEVKKKASGGKKVACVKRWSGRRDEERKEMIMVAEGAG